MPEHQTTFTRGDWVIDINNPGRPGVFTGRTQRQGPFEMLEIEFGPGDRKFRPSVYLSRVEQEDNQQLADRLVCGRFGKAADLRRLITFEKLKGTLHEVIYSMEAAQIDFLPYQFKPVIKFINSPADRLVVADEVGLGKTIESALIWLELQARKQAKRMLVVCPTYLLAEKWRDELRTKFQVDARLASFDELAAELKELRTTGPSHSFIRIVTYSGLRPPRAESKFLDDVPDETDDLSAKTRFCQHLRSWELDYDPFDLVVFDEAHYMRNSATASFQLGESLARSAAAVLCVSATPVNNRSDDLHSLLRLIDDDFFQNQSMFSELLDANKPAVQLANALARVPVDFDLLKRSVEGLTHSAFVGRSPLFKRLLEKLDTLTPTNVHEIAECQDIAEKLNILGGYVTRTRRVQVKEHRPVRDPLVRELNYTPEEMSLYQAIVELVRRRCANDSRPFHVFQVIGLQMRAASSLPVFADDVRRGKLGDLRELLTESLDGAFVEDDPLSDFEEESLDSKELDALLSYDYEANDSKFAELQRLLTRVLNSEKVVIFSFYRGTIRYLERRLAALSIRTATIHGGVAYDERKRIVDEFNTDGGPRILLSSEVGSEGIDLQHNCRALVNYDLPWNPMRIEQRIGRIDRVGQRADRLAIVHFKVLGTIEEKIYDRLHQRLALFANSLGDLETVIGKVVQDLTVDLLSRELSAEQMDRRIREAELVIEGRLIAIQTLEESGDSLLALSDYVQRKIDEDRGRGRFIRPVELESYIGDFFDREFRGSHLAWNTPAPDCITIKLNQAAQQSLSEFIADVRSLSARFLRQHEFAITFRRDVHANLSSGLRRQVHFVNHLSPFIRWITSRYVSNGHRFVDVAAVQCPPGAAPAGTWCYRIERWVLRGFRGQESLAYAAANIETGEMLDDVAAEALIQRVLNEGREWDYPSVAADALRDRHEQLSRSLRKRLDSAIQRFDAENQNALHIRRERIESQFERRIAQDLQRIETLQRANRTRVIRLAEARLSTARRNKAERLARLARQTQLDVDSSEVAAGLILVPPEP